MIDDAFLAISLFKITFLLAKKGEGIRAFEIYQKKSGDLF
jgi:hypothetical protein